MIKTKILHIIVFAFLCSLIPLLGLILSLAPRESHNEIEEVEEDYQHFCSVGDLLIPSWMLYVRKIESMLLSSRCSALDADTQPVAELLD